MRVGARLDNLGTPDLTWADAYSFIRYADHTTAVYRDVQGHNWSIETVLLADIRDVGIFDFYQFNRANGGRMRKPDPFKRPEALTPKDKDKVEAVGQAADLDDIKKFLERKNGR